MKKVSSIQIKTANPKREHLTQTEKRAISAILTAGVTAATVNRKTYYLSLDTLPHVARIVERMRTTYGGEIKQVTHRAAFYIK